MKTLIKRLISSAILISITCLTIFVASKWVLLAVTQVFALLAYYEYLRLIERKGFTINWLLPVVLSLTVPFAVLHSTEYFVFPLICLILFVTHFRRTDLSHAFTSTGLTIFGMVYVVWFMSYLTKIRFLEDGPFWVFFAILLAKGGDAGAYFVGSRFGKVKLIEVISPNKSVEGAWAGFFTTIFLAMICGLVYGQCSLIHFLLMGSLVGVVSQVGDLVESLIKRELGVKDSGVIPGLGGILDVLDSLLFIMPLLYFYLHHILRLPVAA